MRTFGLDTTVAVRTISATEHFLPYQTHGRQDNYEQKLRDEVRDVTTLVVENKRSLSAAAARSWQSAGGRGRIKRYDEVDWTSIERDIVACGSM